MLNAGRTVIVALGASVPSLVAASPAPAVPPPPATYQLVTVGTRTCPVGAVATRVGGNADLTLEFAAFTASTGGGAPPEEAQKTCKLLLKVDMPSTYALALKEIETQGRASLARPERWRIGTGSSGPRGNTRSPT